MCSSSIHRMVTMEDLRVLNPCLPIRLLRRPFAQTVPGAELAPTGLSSRSPTRRQQKSIINALSTPVFGVSVQNSDPPKRI